MVETLTRTEMIELIKTHHYLAFRHELFDDDEYIYSDGVCVRDENNYVFEDWYSKGTGQHNGIRMRTGGNWETGWSVVPHINIKKKVESLAGGKQPIYEVNTMIKLANGNNGDDVENGSVINVSIIKSRTNKAPIKYPEFILGK